jgi:hypothetical protein
MLLTKKSMQDESAATCCCCCCCVLSVVLQDEETGQYRQRMSALNTYCTANNLSAVSDAAHHADPCAVP